MADAEISARIEGGTVQGIVGARTVIIENLVYGAAPLPASPAETSAKAELPPCPYPGLAWFGPQDRSLFFGREAAIARLLEAVPRQGMTALVGASGSGKSSVVLAGLAPRLADSGLWRFSHFRVGTETDKDPFASLARALVPIFADDLSQIDRLGEVTKLATKLKSGEISLPTVLGECRTKNSGRRILLIADQFEELFTLVPVEAARHRFVDVLLSGFANPPAGNPPDVCLVMTLRADFYGMAVRHRPLSDGLQGRVENLGPMTREELREAIEKPAGSVRFEAGLVETLLDDVTSRPGNLPLLQFALREMWFRQEKGTIGHQAYEAIGRVEGALARRAQEIFDSLTDKGANQQAVALFRRLFTRLVTLGEGVEDTRRVVDREELGDEAWALAQRLAGEDNRLLVTTAPEPGHESAEVIHEALIRNWPTLVDWVSRDRAFQSYVRQLKARVEEWQAHPQDEGALLRGAALAAAEDWLGKRREDFSAEEVSFIDASLAARNARRAKEEEERQAELKREQERAAAAADLARARQRQSRFAWALAALSIVTVGFVGYFAWQAFQSSKAATASRNAALAAEDRALTAQVDALNKTAEVRYTQRRAEADRQAAEAAKEEAVAAREEAEAQANRAEDERSRADDQLRKTLRTQSLFLSDLANQQSAKGDYGTALALALEAAPRPTRALVQRPYVWQSEAALYEAIGGLRERLVIGDKDAPIASAAFSPDGTKIVTAEKDNLAAIRDAETGDTLLEFAGHEDSVTSAAFSPDGTKIVTTSLDRSVRIWDAASRGQLLDLYGHDLPADTAVFSPDGKRLLTASDDGTARLWDTTTGAELGQFGEQGSAIDAVAFSPDGAKVLTARSGEISIWDAETRAAIGTIDIDASAYSVSFSPDGTRILAAQNNATVQIFDAASQTRIAAFSPPREIATWSNAAASFSPDGTLVVSTAELGKGWVWNAADGAELFSFAADTGYWLRSAAFSPDGKRLLTVGDDNLARIWDVTPVGQPVRLGTLGNAIKTIAFSADRSRLAAGAEDGSAALWNVEAGGAPVMLRGHSLPLNSVAFSPDATRVVTASKDGTARIFDAVTGAPIAVLEGHRAEVSGASFSPDGTRVLTVSPDAFLWDASNGDPIAKFAGMRYVRAAVFSPDGVSIVTASDDGTLRLWDGKTGAPLKTLEEEEVPLNGAAFSADGSRAASAAADGSVHIFDVATGEEVKKFAVEFLEPAAPAFSPDGAKALAVYEAEVRIFDPAEETVTTLSNEILVGAAAFSPANPDRIAVVEDGGQARIWDSAGHQLAVLPRPQGEFSGPGYSTLAFSPDGTRIALGVYDGQVLLWQAFPTIEDLIRYADWEVQPRDLTPEQRVKFFLDGN